MKVQSSNLQQLWYGSVSFESLVQVMGHEDEVPTESRTRSKAATSCPMSPCFCFLCLRHLGFRVGFKVTAFSEILEGSRTVSSGEAAKGAANHRKETWGDFSFVPIASFATVTVGDKHCCKAGESSFCLLECTHAFVSLIYVAGLLFCTKTLWGWEGVGSRQQRLEQPSGASKRHLRALYRLTSRNSPPLNFQLQINPYLCRRGMRAPKPLNPHLQLKHRNPHFDAEAMPSSKVQGFWLTCRPLVLSTGAFPCWATTNMLQESNTPRSRDLV